MLEDSHVRNLRENFLGKKDYIEKLEAEILKGKWRTEKAPRFREIWDLMEHYVFVTKVDIAFFVLYLKNNLKHPFEVEPSNRTVIF